ncbi:MAG: efflux RND transporter periplasmic adaptor subunit [Vicinamibacteria bacterium]|nr:efflux RND transporter periplasmic adaptor subunit [Vicinamibacteria bacterium]
MKRTLALLTLAVAGAAGCKAQASSTDIVAAGHVEATDVHISAKVAGRLVEAPLSEGDAVKAGALLARLDTTDIEILIRQASADRAQAEADLRLRIAGARKEDIAEMEAQIRATEADIAGAQLDLDRMQGLLDRNSGTTKARDDAKTRRSILEARLGAQKQTLARLRSGSRPEEIDAARARVASIDARIATLTQQKNDATLTSPTEGVLTSRVAEPGELLQAGSPICVITRLSDAWLTVYVTDVDLARIRIGQEATVRTDGGQTRKGRLTYIASKAEFTPKNVQTRDERIKLVYRVKVGLDNADGFFKPGMPAEATFVPVEPSK